METIQEFSYLMDSWLQVERYVLSSLCLPVCLVCLCVLQSVCQWVSPFLAVDQAVRVECGNGAGVVGSGNHPAFLLYPEMLPVVAAERGERVEN